jgi:hypothetical protein
MSNKTISKLGYASAVVSALCIANSGSAQDDHWNGTTTNTLWSNPANWSLGTTPPPGNATTPYAGNVWLDAANGDSVITIASGDVENPGVGNTTEKYNTIFGPEWGVTLNVAGTLNFDWLIFPVQNNPQAPRSYINLTGNAAVSTSGAAIGLGDSWFYSDAPYVTMNLYNNASYSSLGGAGLWLGGHLNIYDNASFLVNGYINADFNTHQNDGTRAIVIGGGTLTLPEGYINGSNSSYDGGPGDVHSFIARGIVRAYGKGFDTNDLNISDNGANTIVTPVPLGGSLQRVYFQSLSRATLAVGSVEQTTLSGDYPSVGGVLLSSSEPGLDPATFPTPIYTSSNPNVVSVDANGVITALNIGTATITATVGTFNSTNSLTVTVAPATLLHEYKFSETSGTTSADSVPGNSPTWNATLVGGATLGSGQVTLDGSSGSVQLPAGILSGLDEVTIETWATFPTTINTWANLYSFGNSDLAGNGENYISLQPHTGTSTCSANFGLGDPGNAAETDAGFSPALDSTTNIQIVAVYHPFAGSVSIYTNGVLAASNHTSFDNLKDPVAFAGPWYNSQSLLAYTLGADPINQIGASLYSADPKLNASINEFRIYSGALTPAQINADYVLGPDQLFGTSSHVRLSATTSVGGTVLKWPTSSALVTVLTSPTLGAGAVWTAVNAPLTTDGSGNYQMTVPAAGSAQFFQLQQ